METFTQNSALLTDEILVAMEQSYKKLLLAVRPVQNARDSFGIIAMELARAIEQCAGENESDYFKNHIEKIKNGKVN